MKKIYSILLLSIFCLLQLNGFAQSDKQKTPRPLFWLGINSGLAWQSSDVRSLPGGGVGATLEVPIIHNDHSPLGISLRARYLYSAQFGKDWQRSLGLSDLPGNLPALYAPTGFYYANHRTRSNNWDLELMLKANRLRARTGILAYIWGGIGAMGYRAEIDQLGLSGTSPHNYANISQTSQSEALNDLRFEWDRRWETDALAPRRPHWVFAPSLGIGLGYEFTPFFSMAFEYKVTFPFTDYLDGKVLNRAGTNSGNDDIHHYGGLGLNFGLFGGGSTTTRPKPRPRPTPRPTAARPQISMVRPTTASVNVSGDCLYDMQARLYNVRNKGLITLTQNGYTVNPDQYTYDPPSGMLRARLQLRRGQNTIKIVVRNSSGTDTHSFTAQCNNVIVPPPPPSGLPPEVYITYPTGCPAIIPDCRTVLYAEVYHVRSKNDITVYHYNRQVSPQFYTYDRYSKQLTMNVDLDPGDNRFEIIARNQFGTDRASTVLRCPTQVVLPTVVITKPTISPFSSINCTQMLEAQVTGVRSRAEITVYVDGVKQPSSAWNWSPSTSILRMTVNLTQGRDATIEIVANNGNGCAADVQVLRCEQQLPPPQVIIVNPPNGQYSGKDCNQRIVARVLNVSGAQDIRVLQGRRTVPQTSWTYNTFNQLLVMDVTLSPGVQTPYTINASNTVGRDSETATLRCEEEPVKMITICHIPPGNPADVKTISIPETQWASHQAHGDVQGPCSPTMIQICLDGRSLSISQSAWPAFQSMGATQGPCQVRQITICHIPPGNPAAAATLQIPENLWAQHQAHGDVKGPCSSKQVTICYQGRQLSVSQTVWPTYQGLGATQGPCPTANINICHIPPGNPAGAVSMTVPADQWPAHQAHGDIQGTCSKQKVQVCMDGNSIMISRSALQAALAMGATQGPCPVNTISICHIPPGNPAGAISMTVKASEWPSHQAHGDIQGTCSKQQVQICMDGNAIMISRSALQAALAMGATQGPCPVTTIQICHIPPRNPGAAATMTIQASEWATHQAHGDIRGVCSKQTIKICLNGREYTVPKNIWPSMQAQGANQGPCITANITICHIPPGNPAGATTMAIPPKQWPTHQAHGDVKGACSKQQVTVCMDGNSVQISRSALQFALAMGATQGPCPQTNITICHIPPKNPADTRTMTIPANQWPMHQAHGDIKAPCSAQTMSVCFNGKTITIPSNAWPVVQAKGATQGPCLTANISICHIPPGRPATASTLIIREKDWATHQAHGDVRGPCSKEKVTVCIRGRQLEVTKTALRAILKAGGKQGPCPPKQIQICHIPPGNPQDAKTILIPENEWSSHQAHGDSKFPCSTQKVQICWDGNPYQISQTALQAALAAGATQGPCPARQIQICHIPPSAPQTAATISIPENTWPTHQAHGDIKGACSSTTVTACFNGQQYTVTSSAWPALQARGATEGPCAPMVTVCHFPPGKPNEPETIRIPQSEYWGHLAHGDKVGECDYTPMKICIQDPNNSDTRTVIEIPTSAWTLYQQQGAVQGECPKEIKICHIPPGGLVWPTTMMIPEEQWESHAPHFDHKGECSHVEIEICHTPPGTTNKVDIKISESAWRLHQQHGDTRGRCPSSGGGKTVNPSEGSGKPTPKPKTETGGVKPGTKPPVKPKGKTPVKPKGKTPVKPSKTTTPVKPGGKTTVKPSGKTIVICHKPPKNPGTRVTKTIPASSWPTYKKAGATMGPCPGKKLNK